MIDNFIEIDSLRCRRFPFETRKTETFFFFFVGSSLIILSFFSLISASQPVKTQRVIQSTAKDITLSFFLLFLYSRRLSTDDRQFGKKTKNKTTPGNTKQKFSSKRTQTVFSLCRNFRLRQGLAPYRKRNWVVIVLFCCCCLLKWNCFAVGGKRKKKNTTTKCEIPLEM